MLGGGLRPYYIEPVTFDRYWRANVESPVHGQRRTEKWTEAWASFQEHLFNLSTTVGQAHLAARAELVVMKLAAQRLAEDIKENARLTNTSESLQSDLKAAQKSNETLQAAVARGDDRERALAGALTNAYKSAQ
jgi:hypothetical protein